MKILVTGLSGLIGSATKAALESDYELTALNHRNVEGIDTHRADIED